MNIKANQRGKSIFCPCGGQVSCGGTIHPLSDLAIGFDGKGKPKLTGMYAKLVIGYKGICMKCQKEGNFILPKYHTLIPNTN